MNLRKFIHSINRYGILLGLAFVCIVVAEVIHSGSMMNVRSRYTATYAEKILHNKEEKAEALLEQMQQDKDLRDCSFDCFHDYYRKHIQEDHIALFVYRDECLVYWSDHNITADYKISETAYPEPFMLHSNAWYRIFKSHDKEMDFVLMIPVKYSFAYENDYLKNTFHPDFNFPSEIRIEAENITPDFDDPFTVHSYDGTSLFRLNFADAGYDLPQKVYFIALLYLLGAIFLIAGLKQFLIRLFPNSIPLQALFMLVALLGLRYLTLLFDIPDFRAQLSIFDPSLYASSMAFPSLGDFLINALIVFYLVLHFWRKQLFKHIPKIIDSKSRPIAIFISLIIVLAFSQFISVHLRGIIEDSNINFNINNLFDITIYTLHGILVIALLLFSFFILADQIALFISYLKYNIRWVMGMFIVLSLIHLLVFHFIIRDYDLAQQFWPLIIFVIILLVRVRKKINYRFAVTLIIICLFALYGSHSIIRFSEKKEKNNRLVFAQKLATNEDPLTEVFFEDVKATIQADTALVKELNSLEETYIDHGKGGLFKQYFENFWEKYTIQALVIHEKGVPVYSQLKERLSDQQSVEQIIREGTPSQHDDELFLIPKSTGGLNYIGRINVQQFTVYILFYSRLIPEELGFPDLLREKQKTEIEGLSNYSYARYVDDKLIDRFGSFNYRLLDHQYDDFDEPHRFKVLDGYSHLVYRPSQDLVIVLSKPNTTFIDKATVFSYLVVMFSVFLILFIICFRLYQGQFYFQLNLKSKIHVALISVMMFSLFVFGAVNYYYIMKQYQEKNTSIISEKIHSVLIEVTQKIGEEQELDKDIKPYLESLLAKFSNVFFTDINLYDVNGQLLASSRDMVFKEGLVSEMMNSEAYIRMAINGKSEFIHQERIGSLNYLSAYLPFRNKDNELLAYLNLPYFAKQSELQNELSGLLVTVINIFVLMFALSIIAAIFASNTITRPLRVLQENLAKIEFGKSNMPINYEGNDEISALVEEYNKKVRELQSSAEKLARSERESAWREMAKQVAHEIKNPLTPMKLSIQHLEHAYSNKDKDFEERFKKVSKTLIEQIESLSNIASEFSNFAKMPKAKFDKVDLSERIQTCIELFEKEPVRINYRSPHKGETWVLADKNLILQVFNNILKNAIQATSDVEDPSIEVTLSCEEDHYTVKIEDNGTGIPEEDHDKIFVPNFTTKSTGMGLGLAMAKNIVENMDGSIEFESEAGKGACFYVKVPCYKSK